MTKVKKDINLDSSCKAKDKKDLNRRSEEELHECALDVEKDEDLKKEMREWDATLKDWLNETAQIDVIPQVRKLLDQGIKDLNSNNVESLTLVEFNRQLEECEDLLLAKMAEKAEADGFLTAEESKNFLKEIRNAKIFTPHDKDTNLARNKEKILDDAIMNAHKNFSKKYKNALKKLAK